MDDLSDTGADVGDDSFVEDPSDLLMDKFNALDSALAHLLNLVDENPAISKEPLGKVLGHRKAAFVQAMKAMQVEGTLPWLSNVKRLAKVPTSRSGQLQRQSSADSNENIRVSKRHESEGSTSRQVRESSLQPPSRKTSGSSTSSYQTGLPPPITSSFTGNTSVRSPTLSWPPPLPPIHDPALERRIFTHKSVLDYNNPIVHEADMHNERLEWIGDSYLGVVVSRYVFASFPNVREGPLSEIRASFVGNEALRSYAMLYNFDKRLIAGNKQSETLEKQRKPIADLFESYIGGLLLDSPRGAEIVDSWLRELFQPKLKQLIDEYRSIKPINKAAKGQLTAMLNGKHTIFEYRWVGGGGGNEGGFHIEIYFTGYGVEKKFLGKGWGPNKKYVFLSKKDISPCPSTMPTCSFYCCFFTHTHTHILSLYTFPFIFLAFDLIIERQMLTNSTFLFLTIVMPPSVHVWMHLKTTSH